MVDSIARKLSKYGVISGPRFPLVSPNTGKCGSEITPYLDTFHAVKIWKLSVSTISEIILAPNQNSLTLDQILAGCSCKVCFYKKLCISNKGKRWFTIDCSWRFCSMF